MVCIIREGLEKASTIWPRLFRREIEQTSYHIQDLVGIWSKQEGIGGILSLPEVSMKQLDSESVSGDEYNE
jgi:hypothetical protein